MKLFSPLEIPLGVLSFPFLSHAVISQDNSAKAFDVLDFVDPLIGTANGGQSSST
jgi:hypothetical protein